MDIDMPLLYSTSLQELFIILIGFFVCERLKIFYIQDHVTKIRDGLFLPHLDTFNFSCQTAQARNSRKMLKTNNTHPCLIPDLRGKHSTVYQQI